MRLESKKISEIRGSQFWDKIVSNLRLLNKLSNEKHDGFYKDYRGIAKLIGCEDLGEISQNENPIEMLIDHWTSSTENVKLLDLLRYLQEIGRLDIFRNINSLIDNQREALTSFENVIADSVEDPEFMKIIPSNNEDNTITFDDVGSLEKSNSYMIYDAYILYADDAGDEEFAFEIKETMESKHFFKLCTKEDLLLGLSFEHDAIMRLLDQKRCDKLIVVLSKRFCQQHAQTEDGMTRFILKFAQALQIFDGSKIVPCARDDYGIAYNLKGYSVLSVTRSGRLFNFWDRLRTILEDKRVSIDESAIPEVVCQYNFEIDKSDKSDKKNNKGFKTKCKELCSTVKKKVKKILIKETSL